MLHYDSLIENLLKKQNLNILDKKKCSITAMNIYNYLVDEKAVTYNNNLVNIEPNLSTLIQVIYENFHKNMVYYIHFDHMTNETSHYFILCQFKDKFVVLQSAVFEFSIYDWLFPEKSIEKLTYVYEEESNHYLNDNDPRNIYYLDALKTSYDKDIQLMKNIEACEYSQGKVLSLSEFHKFYGILCSLEGEWTVNEIPNLCYNYTKAFSCVLDVDCMKSHVKLGIKPAVFKYIYGINTLENI